MATTRKVGAPCFSTRSAKKTVSGPSSSSRERSPLHSPEKRSSTGARRLFTDEETTDTGGSDRLFERLSTLFNEQFSSLADQVGEVRRIQGQLNDKFGAMEKLCQDAIRRAEQAELAATEATRRAKALECTVTELRGTVNALRDEAARSERATNVIITNVEETEGEDLLSTLSSMAEKMGVALAPARDVLFLNRLGSQKGQRSPSSPRNGASPGSPPITQDLRSRPRPIKVVFSSIHTKRRFTEKSSALRDHPSFGRVYINEDLTPQERIKRRELVPKFKTLRANGYEVSLRRATICKRGGSVMSDEAIGKALAEIPGSTPSSPASVSDSTSMDIASSGSEPRHTPQ